MGGLIAIFKVSLARGLHLDCWWLQWSNEKIPRARGKALPCTWLPTLKLPGSTKLANWQLFSVAQEITAMPMGESWSFIVTF